MYADITLSETARVAPTGGHPRLMTRSDDLSRVAENLKQEENSVAVSVWNELCSYPIRGEDATPEYGSYHLAETLAAEALAFRTLLSGNASDAQKAIDAINLLLSRFEVKGGNMRARWGGHLIFVCSEVYDWCYAFLSDAIKAEWIARCEEIAAAYFEMGYPPAKQAALSGHGTEAQLLRDLLAFSIAVYDERPDIYDFCAEEFLRNMSRKSNRILQTAPTVRDRPMGVTDGHGLRGRSCCLKQ